ncbi:MAG TPA: AMP-binding protein, partial [Thermoleophilaceae bacterium]|nr:AMP-binding protein [Thermoleophilaceae bacterium]
MEAGTAPTGQELEDELAELLDQETFEPPAEFVDSALLTDPAIYEEAAKDPVAWWEKQAEDLHWFEKWDTALDESNPPYYKWFQGGKINAAYNCLDRHVDDGKGDKVAFHWRGEEGEQRDVTYAELLADTKKLANALVDNGVEKGDVVGIFLPMIPEVVVAMLACARIGAIHNVVFGGFSPNSVAERMQVSEAKLLITADGARRKGKTAEVKSEVDDVLGEMPTVKTVIVVKSVDNDAPMEDGRDLWWHDALEAADDEHEAEPLDAEHPL